MEYVGLSFAILYKTALANGSDMIFVNRFDPIQADVEKKVYTRNLFRRD